MSTDPNNLVPPGTLSTSYIPTTASSGNVGYMVMSYPGRPPMVPGIPMPPGMGMPYMQIGGPGPMMPVMPIAHPHMMTGPPLSATMPTPAPTIRPYRQHHHHGTRPNNPGRNSKQPQHVPSNAPAPAAPPAGPVVTVFVGNITDKAPDQMIRHILNACGLVVSWKRVQAFGFCEYGSPDAGLRAIRILHEMEIRGKKLVVKVDPKTKTVLDEYKIEKRKKLKGDACAPIETDGEIDADEYMDEEMKNADKMAQERIEVIFQDYENEMKSYNSKGERKTDVERRIQRSQNNQAEHTKEPDSNSVVDLDDANIEEGKRDLITREIGKFREIMKAARRGAEAVDGRQPMALLALSLSKVLSLW